MAEALARLRPEHSERRRVICERFASKLKGEGRRRVVDVGAGPASDHAPFVAMGIDYVGADLALGNAVLGDELGQTVAPASLFNLPFRSAAFPAGWSMSTLQHVPDDQIDAALADFVRILEPGAPVGVPRVGGSHPRLAIVPRSTEHSRGQGGRQRARDSSIESLVDEASNNSAGSLMTSGCPTIHLVAHPDADKRAATEARLILRVHGLTLERTFDTVEIWISPGTSNG